MLTLITASTRLRALILVCIWILCLSGCSITELKHDELQEPAQRQSGVVSVEPLATGFTGGRVGWGRITIFSIPVVPIHIHSDEARDLMDVVRNALSATGYTTRLASGPQSGPVLTAHVDKARFNNYTWIAPLVPTWGRIEATLRLESASGEVLWEKFFEGKGFTFNFTDGYNIAATESVTRLANSMVEAFSAQDFSEALAN